MRNITFFFLSILLISCSKSSTEKNSVNNAVQSSEVIIGDQVWMTKNLSVTHYRNGDSIPQVKNWNEWKNLNTGAWCYYNNDSTTNDIYGKLYNAKALGDTRGLIPQGWHLPSQQEIDALSNFLGGPLYAGGKMKSIGTIEDRTGLWKSPNTLASNLSGFNAVPSGIRYASSSSFDFVYKDTLTSFWMGGLTISTSGLAPVFGLGYSSGELGTGEDNKRFGMSVRCIKD